MSDAIVIGSGPNGLVAANALADRGWDVLVLEAEPEPGGAVRSGEIAPGHIYDRFSAFYPLAAASPAITSLELERYGLQWRRAPLVLAHPFEDGSCAVLSSRLDETMESVESFSGGDGATWEGLVKRWRRMASPFLDGMLDTPFPPVAASTRLLLNYGPAGAIRLARFMLLPLRRLVQEERLGRGATMLLAGNALHADLGPDAPLSGMFGWMMSMLGQEVGFPVPAGGSGELTAAMVRRLEAKGGRVICDAAVERIDVRRGRARAVATASGDRFEASRAILADVAAPILYRHLIDEDDLPSSLLNDLRRFHLDNATFKVDWVVRDEIPWTAKEAARAGTVHLATDMSHLAVVHEQLASGTIPSDPFLVLGQAGVADDARSPAGTQVVWAYTHVPQRVSGDAGGGLRGSWDEDENRRFADRMEGVIESYAPGFRERIVTRRLLSPKGLESQDRNLLNGAINGGTSALHQQLVFRPVPGLGRPETPIKGLYLASSSAHPGGGVHGACGANAARVAVMHDRLRSTAIGVGGIAAGALGIRAATVARRWKEAT